MATSFEWSAEAFQLGLLGGVFARAAQFVLGAQFLLDLIGHMIGQIIGGGTRHRALVRGMVAHAMLGGGHGSLDLLGVKLDANVRDVRIFQLRLVLSSPLSMLSW